MVFWGGQLVRDLRYLVYRSVYFDGYIYFIVTPDCSCNIGTGKKNIYADVCTDCYVVKNSIDCDG